MYSKMEIRAYKNMPWDSVDFFGMENVGGDRRAVTAVFTTHEAKEGEYFEPAFRLGMHEAQILMDSLWDCGLRPSEGTGSAGALAATQKHLDDMRRLVFEKNNV